MSEDLSACLKRLDGIFILLMRANITAEQLVEIYASNRKVLGRRTWFAKHLDPAKQTTWRRMVTADNLVDTTKLLVQSTQRLQLVLTALQLVAFGDLIIPTDVASCQTWLEDVYLRLEESVRRAAVENRLAGPQSTAPELPAAVPPIADAADKTPASARGEPRNREAFAYLVGQGLLMRKNETIEITPRFLHQLWLQSCDPAFISAITDPKQDLNSDESLMLKLMVRLLLPEIGSHGQTSDELITIVDEAAYHTHGILLAKADFLGLVEGGYGEGQFVDHEVCVDVLVRLFNRSPENPSEAGFFRQVFEAWKDTIADSVNSVRDEDPRYVEILTPLMYAVSYDGDGLAYGRSLWEDWRASKGERSTDDLDFYMLSRMSWPAASLKSVSRPLARLISSLAGGIRP